MLNGLLRPAGLPLFHDEKKGRKERINVKSQMARYSGIAIRYIRSILADPRTRNVFFFLLLNVSFTIVEALYGMWTNSLGLASDALHMLFDSSAIAMGLIASVIAKWPPTERFSFGFARVETMAGFVNAGGLVLASIGILWESVTRFLDPPDIITDKLLIVAVLGLLVNLVGIFAFDHGGMHHGHDHSSHDHSSHDHSSHDHSSHDHSSHDHSSHDHDHHDHHDHSNSHAKNSHSHSHNALMHGMFLHVLADTLGSVGVIISSLLIQYFNYTWSDPLCSFFIAILILLSSWPLVKETSAVLLQQVPSGFRRRSVEVYRRLSTFPNVTSISSLHVWELTTNHWVGSVKVLISEEGNEQKIKLQVINVLKELGVTDPCVQIDRDVVAGY